LNYQYQQVIQLRKRRRVDLIDEKLGISLNAAKVSSRAAAVVLTPALQRLGHNPEQYNVSYSLIRRHRIKHRESVAKCLE